jgi:tetratricopeptide (TPR) repeat protein
MATRSTNSGGGSALSGDGTRSSAVFARNGEYWTLGYRGATFQLRDIKGLTYIQRLLRHPDAEFHVLDLHSDSGSAAVSDSSRVEKYESDLPKGVSFRQGLTGDAGEMLDAKAKQEYKRRHRELREELEELRERGDHERAEEVESEVRFLGQELARAMGLGGRDRRVGSAAERARINVSRAIGAAVGKISEHDKELGALLDHSIKTGAFCSYATPAENPPIWQFSQSPAPSAVELEASAPLFVRRETDLLAAAGRTAFVGREAERALLSRLLEQVRRGEGITVMIDGAPGVGKSRLAVEFAAEASQRGFFALAGGCYDREDSPFVPFIEMLEDALAKAPSREVVRTVLGNDAPEMTRLMPQLRRLFPDIPRSAEVPIEQLRRTLFNSISEIVARTAKEAPVLLLVEDLHWADEGSLLLLNHLARSLRSMPVMIAATYRDVELEPSGPLSESLDELTRLRGAEQIHLQGLPEHSVAAMLRALAGQDPPDNIVKLFFAHTEGNPFFVEELYSHLADQARLFDASGAFRHDLQPAEVKVPPNVRLVIGRRLARVGMNTQKILAAAAVLGHSFTFELLAAVSRENEDQLLDCVEEAERAGLINSTVQYPEARFNFSHELIRQTVLAGLSAPRRQRLHLRVADAIEQVYSKTLEDHANDLSFHLMNAGPAAAPDKTVKYLSMAARRARSQGALTESGDLYRQALAVLDTIPESATRDQMELVLRLGLGAVLMATRGYAYAENAASYQRATELGERLGDPMQVVLALAGLAARPLLRGELDTAQALADQLLIASERDQKTRTQIWGHYYQGVIRYHRGEFAAASESLQRARAAYREDEHRKNPQDPGSEALEYQALTAWHMGLADTARACIREALALNERVRKPYARVHCEFYAAFLNAKLRDPRATEEFAQRVVKLSSDSSIPLYFDTGRILYGWAISQQGRCDEGVRCAAEGLEKFKEAGNRLGIGSFLGFFAESLAIKEETARALTIIEEGLSAAPEQPGDIAYLLWLRGELLTKGSSKENNDRAEASFQEAIEVANRLGARTYILRASTSLGRLLSLRGRTAEARALVQPIYESIHEGFDTLDLIEAKQLLDGLG